MIQIDIDMPKTCDDCPFHVYHSGKNHVCVATPLFYPMNLANYKDGRKDFCPLKEVSQEPIIDKIRAEIEEITRKYPITWDYACGLNVALRIIDKYKGESEELMQELVEDADRENGG